MRRSCSCCRCCEETVPVLWQTILKIGGYKHGKSCSSIWVVHCSFCILYCTCEKGDLYCVAASYVKIHIDIHLHEWLRGRKPAISLEQTFYAKLSSLPAICTMVLHHTVQFTTLTSIVLGPRESIRTFGLAHNRWLPQGPHKDLSVLDQREPELV